MQEQDEYYKLFIPSVKKFTSMNGRYRTLKDAMKARAAYIERTSRGIRLDTIEWIKNTIIVKVDKDKNVLEAYCGDCGSVTDHETAMKVCNQCRRVLEPQEMQ